MLVQDRSGQSTPQKLQAVVDRILTEAHKRPELKGLFSTYRANLPQLFADVDCVEAKIKKKGISLSSAAVSETGRREPLGRLVQQCRRDRGLTQEGLTRKAGVPYTTLTKNESGVIRNPSAQVISKLASALSVSLESLLTPQTFHGSKSVVHIFHDVLEIMQTPGEFICITGVDEAL